MTLFSMTQTQKKTLEWPLIFALVVLVQSLEVGLLRLPFGLGPVHVMPVLISYLAVTRSWGWLTLLTFIFSFMGSFTIAYPWPVYVAVQIWSALFMRVIMQTFTLEGRRSFTGLAALGHLLSQVLVFVIQGGTARTLPLADVTKGIAAGTLVSAALAWWLFPLFASWDAYFEHEAEEARELKPGALR